MKKQKRPDRDSQRRRTHAVLRKARFLKQAQMMKDGKGKERKDARDQSD